MWVKQQTPSLFVQGVHFESSFTFQSGNGELEENADVTSSEWVICSVTDRRFTETLKLFWDNDTIGSFNLQLQNYTKAQTDCWSGDIVKKQRI